MDPKAAYRRRMALVMHIISPCVRPKRAHKQNLLIFPPHIFLVQDGPGNPGERATERAGAVGGVGEG